MSPNLVHVYRKLKKYLQGKFVTLNGLLFNQRLRCLLTLTKTHRKFSSPLKTEQFVSNWYIKTHTKIRCVFKTTIVQIVLYYSLNRLLPLSLSLYETCDVDDVDAVTKMTFKGKKRNKNRDFRIIPRILSFVEV